MNPGTKSLMVCLKDSTIRPCDEKWRYEINMQTQIKHGISTSLYFNINQPNLLGYFLRLDDGPQPLCPLALHATE